MTIAKDESGNSLDIGEPESLGLSAEDLRILVGEAQEAFRESWASTEIRTIDELLALQEEKPIQLTLDTMNRIAARYCTAVQKGAGRSLARISVSFKKGFFQETDPPV